MKLTFICASVAAGRDGVGDYTRRLATACTEFGHECQLLALNDRQADQTTTESFGDNGRLTRWPAALSWPARVNAVEAAIGQFSPHWVSWQMVSYGYHPKGVLGPEIIELAHRLRAWRSHVMLHEIWIGVARGDPWWARFTGWRQRRALLAFLHAAAPVHLETSNESYATVLARHGRGAAVAPIFSNIPIVPATAAAQAAAVARHLPEPTRRGGRLVCVTFGSLHRQWRPHAAARLLQILADRHDRDPMLLAIGRTGPHGPRVIRDLTRAGLTTVATGELPPGDVSCLLQAAHAGISPNPSALIGKSGSVAAMLDHGLPVLVPRDDWQLRGEAQPHGRNDPRLARLTDLANGDGDAWLHRRHSPGDTFPGRVARFLSGLSA